MLDHHLTTFLVVADCGSFLAASEKLFISGNAVAKQINLLEQDLQLKLFDRSTRGLTLTPAGQLIYADAKDLAQRASAVLDRARRLQDHQDQVLRVGVSLMNPLNLFLNRWNRIALNHHMRLEIVPYEDTPASFQAMLHGMGTKVDFICCTYDNTFWGDRYNVWKMQDLPIRLTMSRSHSLAEKQRLTPADLKGQVIRMRRKNLTDVGDRLSSWLGLIPGIQLKEYDYFQYSDFNSLAGSMELMTTYDTWSTVHPLLITVPVDWPFTSPYGLIYAKQPGIEMQKLLALLHAQTEES